MKNKWIILLVALICLAPVVAGWVAYFYGTGWFTQRTNLGQLIDSPLQLEQVKLTDVQGTPISAQELAGRWLLVYFSPLPCEQTCQSNLYKMRQVRLAMGKDYRRIQEIVLTPVEKNASKQQEELVELLHKEYARTRHFLVSLPEWVSFLTHFPAKSLVLEQGYVFVVDPLGNFILGYTADSHPDDLFADLRKLLKVSQIG